MERIVLRILPRKVSRTEVFTLFQGLHAILLASCMTRNARYDGAFLAQRQTTCIKCIHAKYLACTFIRRSDLKSVDKDKCGVEKGFKHTVLSYFLTTASCSLSFPNPSGRIPVYRRRGAEITMDEIVPAEMPTIIGRLKAAITGPPKK